MQIKHSILYAEDDFDDFYLLKSAFGKVRRDIDVIHVDDGWEALQHLQNLKLAALYPSLIILDINMEGIGGKETLSILKSHKKYSSIPVVMFSSSKSKVDIEFCRAHGIEIIPKPFSFDALIEIAEDLGILCDHMSAAPLEQL